MPMRGLAPAPGAPAVMVKWPTLHPLYHWLTVDGVRFQSYRADAFRTPLISDDALDCGLIRRFDNEAEAIRAALVKIRNDR